MKHRSNCPGHHREPLDTGRAQAVFLLGMVTLAVGLAVCALLILGRAGS